MPSIRFVIPGRPATKGSVRFTKGNYAKPMCDNLANWTGRAAEIAIRTMSGQQPWRGPVLMHVDWEFERPAKHHRSNDKAKALRDDAPDWHAQTPDIDKLMRALLDALTGIVYVDDCQVCGGEIGKKWADAGDSACTRVLVEFE